jgi:hypothetical protein
MFFHIISWTARFSGKKVYWIQNVFWFYLQLWCETFFILKRFGRDVIINLRRSSCNISRYSWQTLIKFEFPPQIFENYWNIKFHENLSSGNGIVSRVRRDGQTNKDDEANSRFSQYCEHAYKKKTLNCLRMITIISRQFIEMQYNIHLFYSELLPSPLSNRFLSLCAVSLIGHRLANQSLQSDTSLPWQWLDESGIYPWSRPSASVPSMTVGVIINQLTSSTEPKVI